MKNALQIIDKIDKQLQTPRKQTVFPLSPTHRKELRQLRDSNMGDIRLQLSILKDLKLEEFKTKYKKEISKEIGSTKQICEELQKRFDGLKEMIINEMQQLIDLQKSFNMTNITTRTGYGDISRLNINEIKECKRIYNFDIDNVADKNSSKLFEEKYGKAFKGVNEKIEKLQTQYEEAINFGDLELVKKLYYTIKQSDKLFTKIKELKI